MPAHCFSLGFLFFSALAVCPEFYFRHALLHPCSAGSIACLLARQSANSRRFWSGRAILIRFVPLLLFAVALSVPILLDKKSSSRLLQIKHVDCIYPDNPFLNLFRIGTYVREHTEPG